jgi:tetratricopeptide (TPR) repeat protein
MHSSKNARPSGKENNTLNIMRSLQKAAVLFFLIHICIVSSFTQEKEIAPAPVLEAKSSDDLNAEQIIEMNKPALVSIFYHESNYYSYYSFTYKDTTLLNGSGFIFDSTGIIGTNFHVVDGIDSLLVKTSDGSFYNAELLYSDEKNDIALLKIIDTTGRVFQVIKFGNSDAVKVGQDVFAIGSPLGYEYTISQGIIAGIRENEVVSFYDPVTYLPVEKHFKKVIQITAAISPGNSGGALFNKKGEVIGITTYTYTGYGNLNFAVAINIFIELKNSINLANIETDEDAVKKRAESLFFSNLRLARSFKDQVSYNWFYVKQKDTMKVVDSFYLQQDSLVRANFNKAEIYFNKCIEMQPDTFYTYQDLLDMYVFTENYQKAENLYLHIKEKFQSDSLLNLLSSSLANAYEISKEYQKALQFYYKMLKVDSTDITIFYSIANIHQKMGKYKKAIKEYNRILKIDPNYSQAYIQLGIIYYEKLEDFTKARKYLEKANEIELGMYSYGSYNVDLHYYLGMIAVKEGRKMTALLEYLELKNIYTYTEEDNQKKLKLYKAIQKLN